MDALTPARADVRDRCPRVAAPPLCVLGDMARMMGVVTGRNKGPYFVDAMYYAGGGGRIPPVPRTMTLQLWPASSAVGPAAPVGL